MVVYRSCVEMVRFTIWTIFLLLMFLLTVAYFKPQIVANQIVNYMPKQIIAYDETKDPLINTTTINEKFTLYQVKPSQDPLDEDRIVFVICGGAFIRAEPEFAALKEMSAINTVYTCTYPVRFNYTLEYTFEYLENVISMILGTSKPNAKLTIIGISAGAYHGAHIIQRNKFGAQIDKFVGINGYYGYEYTTNLLTQLVDKIIIRGYNSKIKQLQKLQAKTLLITCDYDFIKESTIAYSKENGYVYTTLTGSHEIFWNVTQAKEKLYPMLFDFILN